MIELSGLCSGLALHALRVSASFFDVLRVPALFGRTFAPEEDVDGRHRVAVLSYGWWQRRFGRDPNIVGTTIHLDGGDVEIVGIAPPAVSQALDAETPTDLWMPLVIPDAERMRSPNRYNFYLQALGRLRDGLSRAQASVGLNQMAQVLEAEYPDWNKDRRIGVRPLDEHVVPAGIRSWLLLLLGAVGVVLVIAYANIANLMVARASERQREIGIRAALGASRLRLVRQLVVESLVVSLIGAGVGLVLAWWAVEGLRAAMPDGVPRVVTIALDLRVFAAAVGGAVVSGVVFGLVPAGGCSRPVLTHVLQDGARGATAGRARQRLRSTLAVVLLIGAGLFLVSFVNLMRVDVGFDPAGVLTAWVAPQPDGDMTDRASTALTDTVDRVREIRGVEAVAAVFGTSPAGAGVAAIKIAIPGRTREGGEQVLASIVTADYHRVLRIPLHAGRYFDEGDRRGSEPVVLLGAATAQQYFPGADPVGDVIDVNGTRRQIVGVVGDIRPYRDWQLVSALVYLPVTQHPIGGGHLLIRTTGDPLAPLPLVRAAVAGVLPDVPVRDADALETIMARRAAQRRLSMLLLGVFGVLGLGIALVGVYGLLAYVVTQRTHEVGVRRALGATRMAVTSLLLRRTVTLVGLGLAAGGFAAWGVSTTTKAFLFQLGPTDARIFGGALTVVALCSLVAAALPASRAARGDPMVALRVE